MRLIDADALVEAMTKFSDAMGEDMTHGIFYTHIAPTIDAVPVIRCKDCKFSKAYYHGPESNLGMFTYLCTQGLYGMNADDYCSRAEREED